MAHLLDVIGPIMVGPSSSHTAGAARIGKLAALMLHGVPTEVEIDLYGSFAETYLGHGTLLALLGGLLLFDPDDLRIRDADNLAGERFRYVLRTHANVRVDHPNTVRLTLRNDGSSLSLVGCSLGGGRIRVVEIDGFNVALSGETTVLVAHSVDKPGVITSLTSTLAEAGINIGNMTVSRQGRGASVVMTIEIDIPASADVLDRIQKSHGISRVTQIVPL